MADVYKVPLMQGTPQSLLITFGVTEYRLTLQYRDAPEGGWTLDITDSVSGNLLICGVPLVTGTDLLGQYPYLGISGRLGVYTDGDTDAVPTFGSLGGESNLYFVVS